MDSHGLQIPRCRFQITSRPVTRNAEPNQMRIESRNPVRHSGKCRSLKYDCRLLPAGFAMPPLASSIASPSAAKASAALGLGPGFVHRQIASFH